MSWFSKLFGKKSSDKEVITVSVPKNETAKPVVPLTQKPILQFIS